MRRMSSLFLSLYFAPPPPCTSHPPRSSLLGTDAGVHKGKGSHHLHLVEMRAIKQTLININIGFEICVIVNTLAVDHVVAKLVSQPQLHKKASQATAQEKRLEGLMGHHVCTHVIFVKDSKVFIFNNYVKRTILQDKMRGEYRHPDKGFPLYLYFRIRSPTVV